MNSMTISKLAKSGGVGVETIRYYQRRGLIDTPERGDSFSGASIRRYGEADMRRLRFIRAAQRAGFTLEEIGELIQLDRVDDRPRAREMAVHRIAAIDDKIAELAAARESLAKLAKTCAAGPAGSCPILDAFGGGR
jgi:MerR family transcriptional regulator, mercuric resistance operon regulatory protein